MSDRTLYKGGAFRVTGEVRGCEWEIMEKVDWPHRWPFEVRVRDKIVAVCTSLDAAHAALRLLGE